MHLDKDVVKKNPAMSSYLGPTGGDDLGHAIPTAQFVFVCLFVVCWYSMQTNHSSPSNQVTQLYDTLFQKILFSFHFLNQWRIFGYLGFFFLRLARHQVVVVDCQQWRHIIKKILAYRFQMAIQKHVGFRANQPFKSIKSSHSIARYFFQKILF